MAESKDSESPQMNENSVKTEVERSDMSGGKKQVVLALAKRYRTEQESLESQLRTSISQLSAGLKMTITFESNDPTNSITQIVNIKKDTTDQTTQPRVSRERSPNSARGPLHGAYAMPNPGSTPGDSNSRAQRLEQGEYRILCVDGANTGEY